METHSNSAKTTTNVDGTSTTLIPGHVNTKEKVQKKNDMKARSILLMELPNERLMTFNQYKDAKTLFAAIQTRLVVNEANKEDSKDTLKQISLPSEWNTHVVVWRNKPDLDTMSFDDLYNNFKIVKQEVKGTASSSSNSSNANTQVRPSTFNVSLIDSKNSSKPLAIDGAGFDWSYMADDEVPTNIALMDFSNLRIEFNKSEFNLSNYKRGLASVKEQLVFYKTNEVIFCEQLAVLKRDISYKDSEISMLKSYNVVSPHPTRLLGLKRLHGFLEVTAAQNGKGCHYCSLAKTEQTVTSKDSIHENLNKSTSLGNCSVVVPGAKDTINGDGNAQTRFEITSKQSNDPPLSRGYTLGSGEDSMKLIGIDGILFFLMLSSVFNLNPAKLNLMLSDFNILPVFGFCCIRLCNAPSVAEMHNVVASWKNLKKVMGFAEIIGFPKAFCSLCPLTVKCQVLDLQKAKDAQAQEIAALKKRIQKLERKKLSRPTGLKRLRKVGMSRRVESSEDQESLGAPEDASKQGRSIEDIDVDVDVSLVDKTQERQDDNLMFDTRVLEDDEMHVEAKVGREDEQSTKPNDSTAGEAVTTASVEDSVVPTTIEEITLAQTLIQIKAAKPKVVTYLLLTTTTKTQRPKDRG
ncbi:hypothetical protein Tco_0472229 [Tanacetum coccineum]